MRLCAASFLTVAVVTTMTTAMTACTPTATPVVQQPAQQAMTTPTPGARVVSSGDETDGTESNGTGDRAESRARTVVVETEIFILTESVEGLLPEDRAIPYTVEFGDCLAPPDAQGCCWVELTACPVAATDDSAAMADDSAASDGTDGCRKRRAHGCKS